MKRTSTKNDNHKKRSPNLRRHSRIIKELQGSLLNAGKVEWVDTRAIKPIEKSFNIVDLFCGCGGISEGFREAGFLSIFGVDIDPGACMTYRSNFPESALWEARIEDITGEAIKKVIGEKTVHVLSGGFPCPGFSIAGLKNPNDPRNYLYKEVVRLTKEIKPWFVVMENVPRFVRVGNFMHAIINAFNNIGYDLSVQILEAANYGVPQIRPRTILIGNRFGLKNPYPKPLFNQSEYKSIESAIDDLKEVPRKPEINHEWTEHSTDMIKRISEIPPGGSLYPTYLDAWKRQYKGVPCMTVKENHGGNHVHYELDRCLSAREMARLQSFPDSFLFQGTMKRVLFQIGNAVPPLLAKNVALSLLPAISNIDSKSKEDE